MIACAALMAVAAGCEPRQMLLNPRSLDNGLIIVLPGIDGRASHNEEVSDALCDRNGQMAVEHYDWTVPLSPLYNQCAVERNHEVAAKLAKHIARYCRDHPNKPVFLVGHSGGTAIAVWAAEALPKHVKIEGIIMLASSLSPGYDLGPALRRVNRGIVSFYSDRDALLGAGTLIFGTMDRQHTEAAGKVRFDEGSPAYRKLFQIPWVAKMADTGYTGDHFSCCSKRFIAGYVAGLIRSGAWNQNTIAALTEEGATIASAARTATRAIQRGTIQLSPRWQRSGADSPRKQNRKGAPSGRAQEPMIPSRHWAEMERVRWTTQPFATARSRIRVKHTPMS